MIGLIITCEIMKTKPKKQTLWLEHAVFFCRIVFHEPVVCFCAIYLSANPLGVVNTDIYLSLCFS